MTLIRKQETGNNVVSKRRLEEVTKNYALQSLSKSTRKFYAIDWRIFTSWCELYQFKTMPASATTIAAFIAHQADNHIAPSTLNRRLAAIKLAHESAGYDDSPTKDKLVQATLSGIKRTSQRVIEKKAPATAERLESMIRFCPDTLAGLRDKALLLLGFAGAFRRSELVALTVKDIERTPEGMKVTIRKSKTDPEGKGQVIAIPNGARFRIVEALLAWLNVANIHEGYLFRSIKKGGLVQSMALTDRSVANIVKLYADKAGLTADDFSGHSLRSGFLTSAASAGASPFKMMEISRHKSIETLAGYIRSENLFAEHAGEKFL